MKRQDKHDEIHGVGATSLSSRGRSQSIGLLNSNVPTLKFRMFRIVDYLTFCLLLLKDLKEMYGKISP